MATKFILIKREKSPFDNDDVEYVDIVSLEENNEMGTIWVHGVALDKGVIIVRALNAAGV